MEEEGIGNTHVVGKVNDFTSLERNKINWKIFTGIKSLKNYFFRTVAKVRFIVVENNVERDGIAS